MSPARIPGNGVTLGGSDLDWAVTNRFEGGGGSEVLRSFITIEGPHRSRCRLVGGEGSGSVLGKILTVMMGCASVTAVADLADEMMS